MKTAHWYTLDNTAKFYPFIMTSKSQSSFRMVMELTEDVDPTLLQQAVSNILPRFPSFAVKLKKGLFWFYFEQNTEPSQVKEDTGFILRSIDNGTNNNYLFRLMYYSHQIIFEVFHALCDGKGCFEFVKALTFEYLLLTGKEMNPQDKVKTKDSSLDFRETEDSFDIQHTATKFKENNIGFLRGESATIIKGSEPLKLSMGVIHATMPVASVLALSKAHGCSLTVYLAAVLLKAIYDENVQRKPLKKPLLCFIPIDLRKYYNSTTLRNFVMYTRAGIKEGDAANTLDDFITAVKRDLEYDSRPDVIAGHINTSYNLQHAFMVRVMPLALKTLVFRYGKQLLGTSKHTVPLSNMGICDVPDDMKQYVKNTYVIMNTSKNLPLSCYVNSYNGKLNVVFSRSILEKDIEKAFIKHMTDNGVEDVEVSSNYWDLK